MSYQAPASYELSTPHQDFRMSVLDFARAEIEPHIARWDRDHYFPVELVAKMGQLGLFGLTAPEEYGGAGSDGDFTSLCVAIEALGTIDQSAGITLEAGVGLGINPILSFGTAEQKQRWLPDLVAGRALAGFGLTEPEAGSDAGATRTRAVLQGDEWVIDGSKQFITNSGTSITSVVTVTAKTGVRPAGDGKPERPEISAIIVPNGTVGFTVEPAYDKLGWHSSDTHPLTFSDCRVPASNLLGERGRGFAQFLATLDDGRVAIAALALGCIKACLQMSREYAGQRRAMGGVIGRKQAVAFQIADLEVMARGAELLTYSAAALKDALTKAERPSSTNQNSTSKHSANKHSANKNSAAVAEFKQAAAVAKLFTTQAAVEATRIATQIFGGYGFMEEYPVARFYRDAKILEIGEGTNEIQRLVIARGLGLNVE